MSVNRRYHRGDLVVSPAGMAIAFAVLVLVLIVIAAAA